MTQIPPMPVPEELLTLPLIDTVVAAEALGAPSVNITITRLATTTTTAVPKPRIGHLLLRTHLLQVFARKTSVKLTCVNANCVGSIKLLMRKVVVIHKKKKTFKKIEFLLVGQRGFNIVKGKTTLLPLFIRPNFAKLITPKKRLVLLGELFMSGQKPIKTNFVLTHGILKKKPLKKAKHLVHTKKK